METVTGTAASLSKQDVVVSIMVTAIAAHLVFKRWEPLHPIPVGTLLAVIPAALSTLLRMHYGYPQAALLTFALYYATLLFSIAIHRLSPFHPYAKYPGPMPAKLSMWWMVAISTSGKGHEIVGQLHDEYGDVVRIGPNEISIRDASMIQEIMGAKGMPKGPMFTGLDFHSPLTPVISHRDPVQHNTSRKPWNRAFSTLSNKNYVPVIVKRATQLVDRLCEQKGTIDLATWFGFFTYDFMGDIVFGGGTEMLRDGDNEGLWKGLKRAVSMTSIHEHVPWYTYYARFVPGIAGETKRFRDFCLKRGAERLAQGAQVKDLFYYLNNEDGSLKETPSPAAVVSNSVLAIIAGSDTTSIALSNIFVSLLRQPRYYKRLQDEVDRFYPQGEDATDPQHHSKMLFMEACINEALRLYPVVPSGSQRSPTRGTGGKVVGEHFIPEGHQARVNTWAVHRDPRNFSCPNTFFPERWLIAEGLEPHTEKLAHNPNAFVPFSSGPANCVGKNMALLEMKIVICHLMQRLELRLAPGWDPAEWDRTLKAYFVMQTGELPVIVTPRF